jgi:hypothetical protein
MPPLLPLPPDSTRRVYINYTSGTIAHTLSLRVPAGVSAGTLDDALNEVIEAMRPIMDPEDSVLNVEESALGSNVRFPLFPVGLAGTGSGWDPGDINNSAFVGMSGKGTDGRLVNLAFYNLQAANFQDTRIALGVISAAYADFFNSIAANSTGLAWRTIGAAVPSWNQYFNVARSAYWQREGR